MGANTISFTTLAIMFDPLTSDKLEYARRHAERLKSYVRDLTESVVYYFKRYFYRVSHWTMSLYFWYGFFVWVPLRIVGAAKYDNDAYYVDQPQLVWKVGEEVSTPIFIIAGYFYFAVFYAIFYVWEIYGGNGRFSIEYTVGKLGDFGWWIFGRCFKQKELDDEEKIGKY